MVKKHSFALVLSLALFLPQAKAIVVAGTNPNDPVYLSSVTAVGTINAGAGLCSGSLLATGMHFLTAAHCVLDSNGNPLAGNATVTFRDGSNNPFAYVSSSIVAHPDFDPQSFFSGNDLAIVAFSQVVDASITRLSLYSGNGELGQTATMIGYGRQGTGFTGGEPGVFGVRRQGQNEVDEIVGNNLLLFDFDNGLAAQNSLGGLGLGTSEVMLYRGDSGGPALIGGQIAGIHSFITCFSGGPGVQCASPPDINNTLNGSFGERFGSTRISAYDDWISATIDATSVPEPSTVAAGLLAVVTCLARARRTRSGSPS
jgi:secreted trypsin-like serine protease